MSKYRRNNAGIGTAILLLLAFGGWVYGLYKNVNESKGESVGTDLSFAALIGLIVFAIWLIWHIIKQN